MSAYAYVMPKNVTLSSGGWFNGKFVGTSRFIVLLADDASVRPHCDHAEYILDLKELRVLEGRRLLPVSSFNAVLGELGLDGIQMRGLLPGVSDKVTSLYRPLTLAQMAHVANELEKVRCKLTDELHAIRGDTVGPAGAGIWEFESTRQAAQHIEVIRNGITELRARIAAIKESPTRGGTILNNDTVNILCIASDFNIEVPQ